MYPVATVCLFYLGTIACAFSQGLFIQIKMFLWVALVLLNFARLTVDLWNSCPFPASILPVSPPYDINNNIHMVMFYFFSWIPAGFLFHYVMYGRGTIANLWTVGIFLICAHWPTANSEAERLSYIEELQQEEKRESKHSKHKKEKEQRKKKHNNSQNNGHPPKSNNHTPPEETHQKEFPPIPVPMSIKHILRKCSYYLCNNYEKNPKSFKVCKRCRTPYCSKECQLKDWNQANHKSYCNKKWKERLNKIKQSSSQQEEHEDENEIEE